MNLKNLNLQPSALLAEMMGTFVLATVALTFGNPLITGFALIVLVYALGVVSGAHVNPAVTVGLWSARKFDGVKVPFYLIAQLSGALVALLLMQWFKNAGYGINLDFNQLDMRVFTAELVGAAVFVYALTAVVHHKVVEGAKGVAIGLALMTGLVVGAGLLNQAAQSPNLSSTQENETPRVAAVEGAVVNPAIALAATEKDQQQASLQGLGQEAQPETERPASRLTWETVLGGLLGGVIGANLLLITVGENPFKKSQTVAQKVSTTVSKSVTKTVAKAKKKTSKK